MQKRSIAILGATGSIGTQALDVAARHSDRFAVTALVAHSSSEKLFEQVRQFHPQIAALSVEPKEIPADIRESCQWMFGENVLLDVVRACDADDVLVSVVGVVGLAAVMEALACGKRVLLANKEPLVAGGELVTEAARKAGHPLLPVDSEHSAIFQCVQGCRDRGEIKRLILTCSGGPFYGLTREQLAGKTRADALRHPNWTMGAKITVDSATLMNKGLEIIEAMRLYRLPLRQVDAVIHRQSIVHSLVEFHDGAMLAQLGTPDMKLPIRYAMTYPNRAVSPAEPLDLLKCPPLTFAEPDEKVFRCLKIAKQCAAVGNVYCAAMNGANEEAVAAFLRDEIGICAIPALIEAALDKTETVYQPQLSDILEADRLAREVVREKLN